MKKIISLILTSACLMTGANAFAAMPSNWQLGGSDYEDKSVIRHEKSEVYEGKGALYVKWNKDYVSDTYAHILCRSFSLESGKRYRLGFYAKTAPGAKLFIKWSWDWTDIFRTDEGNEDWTYYYADFAPDKSGAWLGLFADSTCEYYMDNVTIFELDEEGNPVGDNIMVNGDFENGDFVPCGDVSNVSSKAMDSSVELSWDNPEDSDFSYVNIYREDEETGEEIFMVSATPVPGEKRSSVVVKGLENGKFYTFRVYAVDSGENESSGVTSFGIPEISDYYADDVKVKRLDNNKEISAIVSGNLEAFTSVQNNTFEDGMTAVLISVLYKDGKTVSAVCDKKEIAVGETADFSVQVTVPSGSGYKLCSYIWNGQGKILAKSKVLN